LNEKELLDWLKSESVKKQGSYFIGDDAAFLQDFENLYITTDSLVEDVHFVRDVFSMYDLCYRAVSTSLSDLAAMATKPKYILVSLAAPDDFNIKEFFVDLLEISNKFEVTLVGGDISNSKLVFINVTAIGSDLGFGEFGSNKKFDKYFGRSDHISLMENLKENQDIFVTGPLGLSDRGLKLLNNLNETVAKSNYKSDYTTSFDKRFDRSSERVKTLSKYLTEFERDCLIKYLRPEAKIKEAIIAKSCGAEAITDISDSLAYSLESISKASGVGIVLVEVPKVVSISSSDALYKGEDYEIVFSIDHKKTDLLFQEFKANDLQTPIYLGYSDPNVKGVLLNGRNIDPKGFEHKFS
jgi:thiamine-monophosphate kinase